MEGKYGHESSYASTLLINPLPNLPQTLTADVLLLNRDP